MQFNEVEKRHFPRIGFKTTLRFQIRGKEDFEHCLTHDLSLGGLSFVNGNYIPPQTNLMLEINLFSRMLDPIARISWVSPLPHSNEYRYGIEFLEIEPKQREFLSEFIELQKNKF